MTFYLLNYDMRFLSPIMELPLTVSIGKQIIAQCIDVLVG